MNEENDDNRITPAPWPEWAKWLLWSAVAAGAAYLLVKLLRRGGAGALLAMTPAVALAAGGSAAGRAGPNDAVEPNEPTDLRAHLREIADREPMIPPVQLGQALRDRGVEFRSEQQMARALRQLGLQSEVRTVKGRPERRWYDLTEYSSHE